MQEPHIFCDVVAAADDIDKSLQTVAKVVRIACVLSLDSFATQYACSGCQVVFNVFSVVPDPFNYITFFGLRKHEEMNGKLVRITAYLFTDNCSFLFHFVS